jgi:hypothetical protein
MTDKTNVAERIELAPAVAALLAQDTSEARLGRAWVRFPEALLDRDPNRIDDVVTPDARFHELEAAGLAREPHGFTVYTRNRFEGDKMAERWDRADFADLLAQLRS